MQENEDALFNLDRLLRISA